MDFQLDLVRNVTCQKVYGLELWEKLKIRQRKEEGEKVGESSIE